MRYELFFFLGLYVYCSRSKEFRFFFLFDLFCYFLEGKKENNCYIFFISVYSIFLYGMYIFKFFVIDYV